MKNYTINTASKEIHRLLAWKAEVEERLDALENHSTAKDRKVVKEALEDVPEAAD